ncbi:LamG-like jellyroll fold domain-containing protein [Variovorax atrisoli]|uniref:LamG-like jellyroll fold domain-containing protein n=1 Tax=Variovorax atrisoli TaxID=3394203 RepID=UPI00161B05E1|nr:LamG-like jellyroll fold domain-containing protein [Variovorax sp. BK613]MBB3642614.1 hypothetical protein [Variovorax sp. BK613]
MAAHRYWRVAAIETYGYAGLDISEFQLFAGTTRVDASAVLTSNVAPASGSLANLKDGNTGTGASWPLSDLRTLQLYWDFGGAPQDVSNFAIGASADPIRFPLIVTLQYSDDGSTWTTQAVQSGIAWPGTRSMTTTTVRGAYDPYDAAVVSRADFSTSSLLTDERTSAFTASGSVSVVTGSEPFGSGVLQFGAGGYLSRPYSAAIHQWWTGPYTAEAYVNYSAWPAGGLRNLMGSYVTNTGTNDWAFGATGNGALELYYYNGNLQFVTQATPTMALNTWYHVAMQFEPGSPGTIKLFINGVMVASAAVVGTPVTSGLPFIMGRANSADLPARVKGLRVSSVARYPGTPYPFGDYIALNKVRGRTELAMPAVVPSALSIPLPYGQIKMQPVDRGRMDYLTGVIGRGVGRVRGFTLDYVNPLNKPYACRVRLVRESDGLQLREMWSGADGSYDFQFVDELQSYTVVAYYLAHGKRAVVTDGLTLANGKVELMP